MSKEANEINATYLEEWTETVASTPTGDWVRGVKSKVGYFSPLSRVGEKYGLMQAENRLQADMTILACIKCTYGKTTSIIGYVVSEALKVEPPTLLNEADWLAKYGGDEDTDEIEQPPQFRHCHIAHGHSYASQDGQYVGRITPWEKFFENYLREDLEPIINPISLYMMRLMNTRKMKFQVDICYPLHFKQRREYEDSLNVSKVCNKLFEICLIIDNYNQHLEIIPHHINLNYAAVIMHDDMRNEFEKHFAMINGREVCEKVLFHFSTVKEDKYSNFRMGQKLIPLNSAELINPWNINQSFWRELFISLALTELVFNGCCLGFPMTVGWVVIRGTHAGIYENASLHDRYEHGKIAAKMAKELAKVEEMARPDGVYRGIQFIGVADKIRDAIKLGEAELVMSDASGLILLEDVGPTLANWHNYVESPKLVAYGYDSVLLWPNAARIIADWLTTFVSLHERLHCIHGDLHMNNMTINYSSRAAKAGGNHFAYIIGGIMYLFPDDGTRGYFIDSSKSILCNTSALERVLPSHEVDAYRRSLPETLTQFLLIYFPQYEKRAPEIRHYAEVFPKAMQSIAEAVDINNLGKNIAFFSQYGSMKTAPEFVKCGERMVELAARRIADILNDMASESPKEYSGIARECLDVLADFRVPSREELLKRVGDDYLQAVNCDIKLTRRLSEPLTQWKSADPKHIIEVCKKHGVEPPPVWENYEKWLAVKAVKQPKKFTTAIEEWMYI